MDITYEIAKMKAEPGFSEHVGMILIHSGVVRGWSHTDKMPVKVIDVEPNFEKIELLRRQYSQRPGIYKILVEARQGRLRPGDDLLFIMVAGDIRENVKPVLAELLDRIKAEAVRKTEIRGE
ncbi:MAG: molybdenum cofactor biosynthesis protein MoaE [Deltaproteobacteria bacterium]|nr:molybdenum cofactor biosynthesis protein MoaE [Deltaproteobacteria bacterium]